MPTPISRRRALTRLAKGTALAMGSAPAFGQLTGDTAVPNLKGNLRHSVCRWCFDKIPLPEFCAAIKAMGVGAIDLLKPADFSVAKDHGLECSMVSAPTVNGIGGIARAWNRVEHHDILVKAYEDYLKQTAAAGFSRLICFSGNRGGIDDESGLANCAVGLKRILPLAEKLNVTVCMELLNSKVNHHDYQCDRTSWGVELVKRLGSSHFKLLYDIYHMQVMEGDICATIRDLHPYFGHYHTAGVPGRNEIDESQELNYPRIMREILNTGYTGFVAQEFLPRQADALGSLRRAFALCDV